MLAKFTSVTSSMLVGARLVLDGSFSASRFWDRMREERVTSFNYMGGLLSILAKQPADPSDRDHTVTRAYGGGCPPRLWVPFEERFGLRLHEHYGMTEVGIAIQNTRAVRRPGVYRISWDEGPMGTQQDLFAANPDPRESDLARADAAELKSMLAPLDVEIAVARGDVAGLFSPTGREIWRDLALSLLLLLIIESIFAAWVGRSR